MERKKRVTKSQKLRSVLKEDNSLRFEKRFICDEIGYGIVAKADIPEREYLLHYRGELISDAEAVERNKLYKKQKKKCYLFNFYFHEKLHVIDATRIESFGKYINDSPEALANCEVVKEVVETLPCLIIRSKVHIKAGTELRYNYGDKNHLWWRGKEHLECPFFFKDIAGVNSLKQRLNQETTIRIASISQRPQKLPAKQPFIKVEDKSLNYKPLMKNFQKFPTLKSFLSKRKDDLPMPQKSEVSKSYCEICGEKFDQINDHIQSAAHKASLNPQEYEQLDLAMTDLTVTSFVAKLDENCGA